MNRDGLSYRNLTHTPHITRPIQGDMGEGTTQNKLTGAPLACRLAKGEKGNVVKCAKVLRSARNHFNCISLFRESCMASLYSKIAEKRNSSAQQK